jgi:hypothetical protein
MPQLDGCCSGVEWPESMVIGVQEGYAGRSVLFAFQYAGNGYAAAPNVGAQIGGNLICMGMSAGVEVSASGGQAPCDYGGSTQITSNSCSNINGTSVIDTVPPGCFGPTSEPVVVAASLAKVGEPCPPCPPGSERPPRVDGEACGSCVPISGGNGNGGGGSGGGGAGGGGGDGRGTWGGGGGGGTGGGGGNGGGDGGGCPSGSCVVGGVPRGNVSAFPVKYSNGEIRLTQIDLSGDGFGAPWGHTRSYANQIAMHQNLGNGYNWRVAEWPYLVQTLAGWVQIVGGTYAGITFLESESGYTPQWGSFRQRLDYDAGDDVFRYQELSGRITEFDGLTGRFVRQIQPGGQVLEVQEYVGNQFNPARVERSYTSGGSTVTEQLHYEYATPYGDYLLQRVTLRRKVDAGDWENVLRASYTYYVRNESHGGLMDLKTATTATWENGAWVDTGTSYYRYYPLYAPSSSSSSSSGPTAEPWDSRAHMLKYVVLPATYVRMVNDGHDPLIGLRLDRGDLCRQLLRVRHQPPGHQGTGAGRLADLPVRLRNQCLRR